MSRILQTAHELTEAMRRGEHVAARASGHMHATRLRVWIQETMEKAHICTRSTEGKGRVECTTGGTVHIWTRPEETEGQVYDWSWLTLPADLRGRVRGERR